MIKLSRSKLIQLYDVWSPIEGRGSDVSAITGVIGEDLLFGLFQHYWTNVEGGECNILQYSCTTGTRSGPRLDGWILCKNQKEKLLYQVEVKNWAVYSIGEKELPLRASSEVIDQYSKEQWNYYFGGQTIGHERVAKVLVPMKKPAGFDYLNPMPLCCFWVYIAKTVGVPFSRHTFENGDEVHVFSASAYIRGLSEEIIEIDMPRVERRLSILKELIVDE